MERLSQCVFSAHACSRLRRALRDFADDASDNGTGPNATGPAAAGLCQAFTAGEKDQHGSALDGAAFQALATAGGEDQIESYREQVLADAQSPRQEATPPADPASTNAPSEPRSRRTCPPTHRRTITRTARRTPRQPTIQPASHRLPPRGATDPLGASRRPLMGRERRPGRSTGLSAGRPCGVRRRLRRRRSPPR
jgi:hypothetical protein